MHESIQSKYQTIGKLKLTLVDETTPPPAATTWIQLPIGDSKIHKYKPEPQIIVI